jgi:hypothetical protein
MGCRVDFVLFHRECCKECRKDSSSVLVISEFLLSAVSDMDRVVPRNSISMLDILVGLERTRVSRPRRADGGASSSVPGSRPALMKTTGSVRWILRELRFDIGKHYVNQTLSYLGLYYAAFSSHCL